MNIRIMSVRNSRLIHRELLRRLEFIRLHKASATLTFDALNGFVFSKDADEVEFRLRYPPL